MEPVELILSRLQGVRPNGNGYIAQCPAHEDAKPSLAISCGTDGRALVTCFAGCSLGAITEAIDLGVTDLFPEREKSKRVYSGSVTMADLAKDKALPIDFLKSLALEDRPAGVLIPYRLPDGSPASRQRLRTGVSAKDGSRWLPGEGSPVPYGMERLGDARDAGYLFLVEGESDAWTLWHHGFPALGIPGASMARKIEAEYLEGVSRAYYWREPDKGGDTFAMQVPARLREIGFVGEIREVRADGVKDPNELHKKDPAGFDAVIRKAMDAAPKVEHPQLPEAGPAAPPQVGKNNLPVLWASNQDMRTLTTEAWGALQAANIPPRYFRHGGVPARIEEDDNGAPVIRELTVDRLRHTMALVATWKARRLNKNGVWSVSAAKPPLDIIKDMLATPDPPLPVLNRIVEAPVFSPDGSVATEPGYHPAGRIWYAPASSVMIPPLSDDPGPAEVRVARTRILELFMDFPFVSDSDLAHIVALTLLPFVRDMIDGPTPNHLIEAPVPGAGKGLLADVALSLAVGRHMGVVPEARNDEEMRKRITAQLRAGRTAILLDNIVRGIDSGVLAAALTATVWDDRVLGETEMLTLPVRCAWITTANNPTMTTEIARRSIRIRLDPKSDRPWQREGFVHPDLRTYAADHRGELIHACLVLVKSWVNAGKPSPPLRPLGSYEAWSNVIGGILDHAEFGDFLGNLEEFYEIADMEGEVWRRVVGAWWEKFSDQEVGTSDLFPIAAEMDGLDLGKGGERSQKITFGKKLSRQRDRVVGNHRIVMAGTSKRANQWRLIPTKKAAG